MRECMALFLVTGRQPDGIPPDINAVNIVISVSTQWWPHMLFLHPGTLPTLCLCRQRLAKELLLVSDVDLKMTIMHPTDAPGDHDNELLTPPDLRLTMAPVTPPLHTHPPP